MNKKILLTNLVSGFFIILSLIFAAVAYTNPGVVAIDACLGVFTLLAYIILLVCGVIMLNDIVHHAVPTKLYIGLAIADTSVALVGILGTIIFHAVGSGVELFSVITDIFGISIVSYAGCIWYLGIGKKWLLAK